MCIFNHCVYFKMPRKPARKIFNFHKTSRNQNSSQENLDENHVSHNSRSQDSSQENLDDNRPSQISIQEMLPLARPTRVAKVKCLRSISEIISEERAYVLSVLRVFNRLRASQRMASENVEQRERRLQDSRWRAAHRVARESVEQRERRLEDLRRRAAQRRAKRNGYSQNKSMYYVDDNVQSTDGAVGAESNSEGYVCNECNQLIKGGRITCAQCVDYDLCAQCAGERAAHRQHYLLRVPPRRPPDEVERILQTIRSMLETDGAADPVPVDETKDKQREEMIAEIKEEIEIHEEPLSYGIKLEIQEEDNYETLKRVVPVSVDIEYTTKRRKQETRDVTSASPGVLQSSLAGRTTADADCTVPSVVKQKDQSSLQTLIITPSMVNTLIPTALVTNTSSHVQGSCSHQSSSSFEQSQIAASADQRGQEDARTNTLVIENT